MHERIASNIGLRMVVGCLVVALSCGSYGFAGEGHFIRSDADGNGRIDVTDAALIAQVIFLDPSAARFDCDDALDVNDNGQLDAADGVFLLQYLFQRGAPLPPPFAKCGADPTAGDGLDCEEDSPSCRETCDDALDNDGDELVDCDDPDCAAHPACAERCDNGADDDGDGRVDCDDVEDCPAGQFGCSPDGGNGCHDWALYFGGAAITDRVDATGAADLAISLANTTEALAFQLGVRATAENGQQVLQFSNGLGTDASRLIELIITSRDVISHRPATPNTALVRGLPVSISRGSALAPLSAGDFLAVDFSPAKGGPGFTVGYVADITGTGDRIPATSPEDPCPLNEVLVLRFPPAEDCDNQVDDDGDGAVDCDDPECASQEPCASGPCPPYEFRFGVNGDGELVIEMRNQLDSLGFQLGVRQELGTLSFSGELGQGSNLLVELAIADRNGESHLLGGDLSIGPPFDFDGEIVAISRGAAIAPFSGSDFLAVDLDPTVGGPGFVVGYAADIDGTGNLIPATPDGDPCPAGEVLVLETGGPIENCDNGVDDDGDGATDCDDPDCADDPACRPEEICDNGVDDDGDGATDCDDADCADDPACRPEEVCDNGVDDDLDGATDCQDPDCAADPACQPNEPPDCSGAVPSTSSCWPPNHRFALVEILGVVDADGDPVTIEVTAITQDEPEIGGGRGSGSTCPDAVFVDATGDDHPDTAGVRCEREGAGNGRVYRIHFMARDGRGGECGGSVEFCVPHDQRPGTDCIDDGQEYVSGSCSDGDGGAVGDRTYSLDEFHELTPEPLFLRGDVNWDESYDVSDAIRILDFLFESQVSIRCSDAADVNDDGDLDVSDPIALLGFLFIGDTRPPPPVVVVDADPTPDLLHCE